jgi:hypothetical protein
LHFNSRKPDCDKSDAEEDLLVSPPRSRGLDTDTSASSATRILKLDVAVRMAMPL